MTGVRSRVSEVGSRATGPAPRPLWFFFAVLLLTLPIVSHGCHRWDHDDEPALAPIDRPVTAQEPAR